MRLTILLLSLLLPINAWAVDGIPASREWQQAGFGGSGVYTTLIIDNEDSSRLYVASDVAGAFLSTSGAERWQFMNRGVRSYIGAAIAQSESNPDVLYMCGQKITKSQDKGRNWSNVGDYSCLRPTVHRSIAIDRNDPNTVYVGLTNGKVIKTSNGGQTWADYATPFGSNQSITFVYINPDSSYLMVGGQLANGMKLYDLSDDSSSAVTLTGTNATYNWDYDTYKIGATEYFCVGAGWTIACTDDISSGSWTYTSDGISNSLYIISRVDAQYLLTNNLRLIFHARKITTPYETVYDKRSVDGGATWVSISNNVTSDVVNNPPSEWNNWGELGNVEHIVCDEEDDNVCYITTSSIWKSTDGGVNYVEKVVGAMNVVITDVEASPNGIMFMSGMDVGVLRSLDNGDFWDAVIPNTSVLSPQGFAVAGHYWQIELLGSEADWNNGVGKVVTTSSYWADSIPRVAYSSDNGLTWTITQSGLPTTILNSSTGASDPNRAAWGVGYPRALAKCPSNHAILYLGIDGYSATENGGIFKSTDYGHTWTRTTQPEGWKVYNALTVDPTDATCNTVVFSEWFASTGGTNRTYRSTDGGATWVQGTDTSYGTYEMDFASDGKAYKTGLYSNPAVHNSADGSVWALMSRLTANEQVADGIYPDLNNPNRIFVGINDGTDTGPGTGTGRGSGAVYMTADAQNGASATWYNITGDLPALTGVNELTINTYQGDDWLFIATDGAGVFRLNLKDRLRTTISNVGFNE